MKNCFQDIENFHNSELKDYEYVCEECNGAGFWQEKGICNKCYGKGKYDWIEKIIGVKNNNYMLGSIYYDTSCNKLKIFIRNQWLEI